MERGRGALEGAAVAVEEGRGAGGWCGVGVVVW